MSSPAPAVARNAPLVPSAVLGMAIFIATELMFYGGLISAFLVLKAQAVGWPPFDQPRLPVGVTAVNTGVLLASGWAMQRAHRALRRSEAGFARWLGFTWLLGALFLTVQGAEWVRRARSGCVWSTSASPPARACTAPPSTPWSGPTPATWWPPW
jgi:heme/copper-type cytochrome/quinol oxidase subunit 3